jgi:ADP-ribosylglycohydrolase
MGYAERARNALYALAAGDALGWPAFYHRTYALPFWTRRLRREIDAAQEERGILRFPMPFSLNRATESLQFYPTDDTEWACFTADMLFACGGQLTREFVAETWEQLANAATEVRGTISIQGALHNFREGLQPPVTGRDNPHYFDDGACSRAVVIGIAFPGRSQEAAMSAEIDGEVTNAFDGLWAAQAVAAALAAACGGASLEEALAAALQVLPQDSWVKRVSEEALRGGEAFGLGAGSLPRPFGKQRVQLWRGSSRSASPHFSSGQGCTGQFRKRHPAGKYLPQTRGQPACLGGRLVRCVV